MSSAKPVAKRKSSPAGATKKRRPASKVARRPKKTLEVAGRNPSGLVADDQSAFEVFEVRSKLGFSQPELSRITGYSVRAIAGWESGKPVSEAARKTLVETERLRRALVEIVPQKQLARWMRSPNPAFEGQTPIQIIERGEADRLWRMIFQIDANVAS